MQSLIDANNAMWISDAVERIRAARRGRLARPAAPDTSARISGNAQDGRSSSGVRVKIEMGTAAAPIAAGRAMRRMWVNAGREGAASHEWQLRRVWFITASSQAGSKARWAPVEYGHKFDDSRAERQAGTGCRSIGRSPHLLISRRAADHAGPARSGTSRAVERRAASTGGDQGPLRLASRRRAFQILRCDGRPRCCS